MYIIYFYIYIIIDYIALLLQVKFNVEIASYLLTIEILVVKYR